MKYHLFNYYIPLFMGQLLGVYLGAIMGVIIFDGLGFFLVNFIVDFNLHNLPLLGLVLLKLYAPLWFLLFLLNLLIVNYCQARYCKALLISFLSMSSLSSLCFYIANYYIVKKDIQSYFF